MQLPKLERRTQDRKTTVLKVRDYDAQAAFAAFWRIRTNIFQDGHESSLLHAASYRVPFAKNSSICKSVGDRVKQLSSLMKTRILSFTAFALACHVGVVDMCHVLRQAVNVASFADLSKSSNSNPF